MHLQQILDEHGGKLFSIAFRVLHHAGDAEDVVQDVLLESLRKQQAAGQEVSLGLLCRMTSLRAIDCLRRRHKALSLDVIGEPIGPVDMESRDDDSAQRLRSLIAALPEQQAKAFVLKYIDGLNQQEIAEALATTPSAVSSALHKARASLRENWHKTSVVGRAT